MASQRPKEVFFCAGGNPARFLPSTKAGRETRRLLIPSPRDVVEGGFMEYVSPPFI